MWVGVGRVRQECESVCGCGLVLRDCAGVGGYSRSVWVWVGAAAVFGCGRV